MSECISIAHVWVSWAFLPATVVWSKIPISLASLSDLQPMRKLGFEDKQGTARKRRDQLLIKEPPQTMIPPATLFLDHDASTKATTFSVAPFHSDAFANSRTAFLACSKCLSLHHSLCVVNFSSATAKRPTDSEANLSLWSASHTHVSHCFQSCYHWLGLKRWQPRDVLRKWSNPIIIQFLIPM